MSEGEAIKISIADAILRIVSIIVLAYSVFDLLLVFVFNVFTQSIHAPKISFWKFGIPYLFTMLCLILVGINLINGRLFNKSQNLHLGIKLLGAIFLTVLIGWQLWFIIPVIAKQQKYFIDNISPIMGMLCTILVFIRWIKITGSTSVRHNRD